MTRQDRRRWDSKWQDMRGASFDPNPLLLQHQAYMKGGLALDLACGQGQNAIWLARQGYHVLGLDISLVALKAARQESLRQGQEVRTLFAVYDLDWWRPAKAHFDLIAVFRFLDRRLYPAIKKGLKSGGLIFYSTRHCGLLVNQPEANVDYLLQPGELQRVFGGWELLHYQEGAENTSLVARKPIN